MTAVAIALCLVCQLFLVGGQLFFKHAMAPATPQPARRTALYLSLGIAAHSLWFFLWLGLLQHWELSRIFPFEGLNPVILVLAAWVILKERIPPAAWLGIVLIAGGVALVSRS